MKNPYCDGNYDCGPKVKINLNIVTRPGAIEADLGMAHTKYTVLKSS